MSLLETFLAVIAIMGILLICGFVVLVYRVCFIINFNFFMAKNRFEKLEGEEDGVDANFYIWEGLWSVLLGLGFLSLLIMAMIFFLQNREAIQALLR